MSIRKLAVTLTFVGLSAFTTSCFRSDNAASELLIDYDNPPSRRIQECGIEGYESSRRPACDVESYLSLRTANCPVELYKENRSMQCPGSKEGERYTRHRQKCDAGDKTLSAEIDPNLERAVMRYECQKPDTVLTCRLPSFGVEQYQSCQHPSHGGAVYRSCQDDSKPIFASCTALTRVEIELYLSSTERDITSIGPMLVVKQSQLFKSTVSEAGLACLIKKYELDPFASGVIADLKTQFPIYIGREYTPELAVNCEQAMRDGAQVQADCGATPTLQVCKDKLAFESTLKWLTDHRDRTIRFQSQPAVQSDADLSARLSHLNAQIATYLK